MLKEARELLATLGNVAPISDDKLASAEDAKAELMRAESTLWGWYLEWSQVARTAIKQRALLRQLGFLTSRGGAAEEEDEVPSAPLARSPAEPIGTAGI